MTRLLELKSVSKIFGGLLAVNEVSLALNKGDLLGLIGPNGAGKSTLINLISGYHKADEGKIFFKDLPIHKLPAHKVAHLGIGRTFQITKIFQRMSVADNLRVALYAKERPASIIDDVANFLKLKEILKNDGRHISGGQQKLLALGRLLALDPEVILLDEPFAGLHEKVKGEITGHIKTLNKKHSKTFIIASHDLQTIKDLCPRIMVMGSGKKIVEGTFEEIIKNEWVVEAYLS